MDLFSNLKEPSLPFSMPKNIDFSCEWNPELGVFAITVPRGNLMFAEDFFKKKVSDRCLEYFQEIEGGEWNNMDWPRVSGRDLKAINFKNIKWKQDVINMFGKEHPLPRLTSWYGDQDMYYKYSGITSHPNPWNKGLLYIRNEIEKVTAETFNSVLLNWYRNGADYLNWHADDEKELGENPTIASANFGETRDFVIRRSDNPNKKITIPLRHGSLLVMSGPLQHYWQHSVPKRKRVNGSRFNLTFRHIIREESQER